MLTWPMDAIGWVLSMSEECQTASERLNEVLDSRPEIADRAGARALERCRGRIELRGVGFKYPEVGRLDPPRPEPGHRAGRDAWAWSGAPAAARPRLAYLLPRLYDVAEGQVLLDGIDVRDLQLRSLRSHIGVAFEDPILFSASVHENLVMGRPVVVGRGARSARSRSRRPASSGTCRGASRPESASRATRCPAASGSGSRSRGRCSAGRRCWCSTTRSPRSTSTPRR